MEKVIFTSNLDEAKKAMKEGAVPVEGSYGSESIASDPKEPFDHHNQYSSLYSASHQAMHSSKHCTSVVVNHVDLDCVMASSILLGEVSRNNIWIKKIIPILDIVDRTGLHNLPEKFKKLPEYQLVLYFFQKSWSQSKSSFLDAIKILRSFQDGPNKETEKSLNFETERKEKANKGIVKIENNIMLVNSDMWGYDEWYKKGDVVVSFDPHKNSVSIGINDNKTAEKYFGKGGLKNVFPKLGPGWGGRENVGGSPRGEKMTFKDTEKAFEIIKKLALINKKAKGVTSC